MKKHMLISATLLMAFAGCTTCGQGWRPNIFTRLHNFFHGAPNVGAPCDAGCEGGYATHVESGCTNCGETAAYGSYDGGTVIGTYEGTPVSQGVSALPQGSYTTPANVPREVVGRRLAN